jgi:hypothetical protein
MDHERTYNFYLNSYVVWWSFNYGDYVNVEVMLGQTLNDS